MTKRRMYHGKVYEKDHTSPSNKPRGKKWRPKPKPTGFRRRKTKGEPKTLMCHQDKKKPCQPKQLRMAPGNFCNVTEMHCKRLKRWKYTNKRRGHEKPKPEPDEKKTVFGEWTRVLHGGLRHG